jgi:hypothetical protein
MIRLAAIGAGLPSKMCLPRAISPEAEFKNGMAGNQVSQSAGPVKLARRSR